jgi:small subunit ribosomal protein S21
VSQLATVTLRPGESQEQLLKRFRKKVQRERVLSDVKKTRFFMSNSEKRRLALRKAKRRQRRRELKRMRWQRRYR